MRRLHLILGIITLLLTVLGVGMALLGLLIYQATPNSVLAHETFVGRMPGVLRTVRLLDHSLNVFYRGQKPPEKLPRYKLDIDRDDLARIEASLPTELPSPWYGNFFLTEDSKLWAKGVFTADGESYDVKVRVRGDIFNHWAYRKKSWRVEFPKDHLFRGMREVNLIIPEDRLWFAEPLNVYRMQKFHLVHSPMSFVTVSLNGSAPLLYTQVEHWTKEMLEKQGRSGDVNVYQTGGGDSYFQQWDPAFDEIGYWDKYFSKPGNDTYEEVDLLLRLSGEGAHTDPHYLEKLKSIVDVDSLVSWYVVSLLAGSRHVLDFNVRFLFDPSRGQFEPLPWDISLYAPRTLLFLPGNKFLNEVFRVPALKLAAHRALWEYVQNDEQVADDLAERDRLYALIERTAYRDPLKLQSNRQVKHELERLSWKVEANLDFIRDELKVSEVLQTERIPSQADQQKGVVRTFDFSARGVAFALLSEIVFQETYKDMLKDGKLQLWRDNGDGIWSTADTRIGLSFLETQDDGDVVFETQDELQSLLWSGDPVMDANGGVITAPHTHHRFFLVSQGTAINVDDMHPKPKIRNAVTEKKADVIGNVLVDERTFERLDEASASRAAFLAHYPFFAPEGEDGVVLRGVHIIQQTIIVPSTVRLRIIPGTTLRFAKGTSLLSYAPVTLIGYKDQLIRFLPLKEGEPWGVFAVLNVTEPSAIQWAEFAYGGDAYINGTFFSGMVAFHNSPVTVADAVIRNAHGDDGLNLKYVYVDVNRVRFEKNSADGLDIDMPLSGVVENSLFLENGNDGIDISWSPIVIRNVESVGNGDKCISVGERSTPLIYDTTLKGCSIGLAVKDDSHAKLERVHFLNNATAIESYIKKPFFAAPSVSVRESTFEKNGQDTLALSGAVITIDSAQ
ncbi:hypothetical protein COU76_02015 [Candidatus Peregrinibacteria bacterium CG10_big_fil_rev_8_21_14_0_10_49_10]|nr:MAG: hypothetical protein COU76_02015 [Candidatus Peregrinibacteria bacterium CG10_big_fil_rev_8_21_14_0_10_49_10]